jgi:hypothetical protein
MDDGSTHYSGVRIGGDLPPDIVREPDHIETLMACHLAQFRDWDGPVRLAWLWPLTGAVTSPVTMLPPTGHPPSRDEILEERDATAPNAISSETGKQIELARRILAWLIGETEEPPA